MRLRLTPRAAAELDEILTFIDKRSPRGASNVKARIRAVVDLLLRHPEAGKVTSRRQLRRATVHPYPYFVFYKVVGSDLVIHGIRHSARDPRSMPK